MKIKYIDSARLFKVLAEAEKKTLNKKIKISKRKQKWENIKRRLGL